MGKKPSAGNNSQVQQNKVEIMKYITGIAGVLALVGMFFAAYFFIDERYALEKELRKSNLQIEILDKRLQSKIIADSKDQIQNRIWTLEELLEKEPSRINYKNDIKELQMQKSKLEEQYKELREQIRILFNEMKKNG